jgi:hypothetical protein
MNTPEQIEALVKAAKAVAATFTSPEEQHAVDVALVQALAPFLTKPEKVYTMPTFQPAWVLGGARIDNTGRQYVALETCCIYKADYNDLRELTAKPAPKKKAREYWVNNSIAFSSEKFASDYKYRTCTPSSETIHVREVLP